MMRAGMAQGRMSARRVMAAHSPVNRALLCLIIQRPSYRFELAQRFERTFGDAIELSSRSVIYTAIDNLASRGLIEVVPSAHGEEDADAQSPPHYRATKLGVESYERWLVDYLEEDRYRARLFARQLAVLAPEHGLRVLSRISEGSLREIGRPPAGGKREERERREAVGERLVEEEQRLRAGAMLSWIQFAKRELRASSGQPE